MNFLNLWRPYNFLARGESNASTLEATIGNNYTVRGRDNLYSEFQSCIALIAPHSCATLEWLQTCHEAFLCHPGRKSCWHTEMRPPMESASSLPNNIKHHLCTSRAQIRWVEGWEDGCGEGDMPDPNHGPQAMQSSFWLGSALPPTVTQSQVDPLRLMQPYLG